MQRSRWCKGESLHRCWLNQIRLVLFGLILLLSLLSEFEARAEDESGPVSRELEHFALRLKAAEKAVENACYWKI